MNKLLIHIGTNKTGSSSIQANLKKYQDSGKGSWGPFFLGHSKDKEFGYLGGSGIPNGIITSQYLSMEKWPRLLRWRYLNRKKQFEKDCKLYQKLIRKIIRKKRFGILSSEHLSLLNSDQVSKLHSDLETLGVKDFRIIVYVREPVSFYRSSLQQYAKFSTDFSSYNPYTWRYQFKRFIETWQKVFPEKIIVRPFDRKKLFQGCVVQDFYRELSSYFGLSVEPKSVITKNEILSTEVLFVFQDLLKNINFIKPLNAKQYRRIKSMRRRITSAALPLPSTPLKLHSWVPPEIWKQHQKDLDWLEEHFQVKFDKHIKQKGSKSGISDVEFKNDLEHLFIPTDESDIQKKIMLETLSDFVHAEFPL